MLAGGADIDPNNARFTGAELLRVQSSLNTMKSNVRNAGYLAPEQFDLLNRKLDEIQAEATRMGRKDWVIYVAGTLSSLCIAAAFAPDVTRKLFASANEAFTWLFSGGILLLQ